MRSVLAAHQLPLADKSERYECLPTRLPGAPTSRLDPHQEGCQEGSCSSLCGPLPGSGLEAVAHAGLGLEVGGVGWVWFEFVAQLAMYRRR